MPSFSCFPSFLSHLILHSQLSPNSSLSGSTLSLHSFHYSPSDGIQHHPLREKGVDLFSLKASFFFSFFYYYLCSVFLFFLPLLLCPLVYHLSVLWILVTLLCRAGRGKGVWCDKRLSDCYGRQGVFSRSFSLFHPLLSSCLSLFCYTAMIPPISLSLSLYFYFIIVFLSLSLSFPPYPLAGNVDIPIPQAENGSFLPILFKQVAPFVSPCYLRTIYSYICGYIGVCVTCDGGVGLR